jgi:hypothetical protein
LPKITPLSEVSGSKFAPTRRGLVAALVAMSTVVGARAAKAGAIVPGWVGKGGGGGDQKWAIIYLTQ